MKRARPNRRKAGKRELPKLPAVPRLNINWEALFSLTATVAIAVAAVALGREFLKLPVKHLEIDGSFQRVTALEIRAIVEPAALGKSILSLDLDDIRQRITAIDWVDSVRLRRDWPNTLRISYVEHLAAARWGETALLNRKGELFAEDVRPGYQELPLLVGPDGSHRRVATRYLQIRDRLARTDLKLESFRMDARGAFSIVLAGGVNVRIGRDDVEGRIDRFFSAAVPALVPEINRAAYIDMRYPKGFAVGWQEMPATENRLARVDSGG